MSKKIIHSPHDSLVKKILSNKEHSIAFLEEYLPKNLKDLLDLNTLKVLQNTSSDGDLNALECDVLMQVSCEGGEVLVYLLLEHQSSYKELMSWRFLKYLVRGWEAFFRHHPKAKKLPPIFPILLSQVKGGWKSVGYFEESIDFGSNTLKELLLPYTPCFQHFTLDLEELSPIALENRFVRLMLLLLETSMSGKLKEMEDWVYREFAELEATKATSEMLQALFSYLLHIAPNLKPESVIKKIIDYAPQLKETAMTAAEVLEQRGFDRGIEQGKKEGKKEGIEKGIEKGREKGREEGIQRGEVRVTSKQLRLRFREKAKAYASRLETLSTEQLELVGERILTCSSIEEVFQGM